MVLSGLSLLALLSASSAASAVYYDRLYIIENSRFFAVEPDVYNDYEQRGGIWWAETTSMANHGLWGYPIQVIESESLLEVDPDDGSWDYFPGPAGQPGTWPGSTRMVAAYYNSNPVLFITESGHLWRVDWNGNYVSLGPGWDGTTSMAAANNRLFIVQDGTLWRATYDGAYTLIGGYWPGETHMTAHGNSVYVVQQGTLWKVDAVTNVRTHLTNVSWSGTTSMTYMSGSVFIIRNSRLYEVKLSDNSVHLRSGNTWIGPTFMTQQSGNL
jgi:hypothetical protein